MRPLMNEHVIFSCLLRLPDAHVVRDLRLISSNRVCQHAEDFLSCSDLVLMLRPLTTSNFGDIDPYWGLRR